LSGAAVKAGDSQKGTSPASGVKDLRQREIHTDNFVRLVSPKSCWKGECFLAMSARTLL